MDSEAPVRLCCMQRHFGPICPDGKVMCELCFDRFDVTDLNVTEDGPEDICKGCAAGKEEAIQRRLKWWRDSYPSPGEIRGEIRSDQRDEIMRRLTHG